MAGRGRGRGGSGLSLTTEQIQALGVTRGDTGPPTLVPPPLFPKLEKKPLPLVSDAATDYMLLVKDQFIEHLHGSPAFVEVKTETDGVERYSDQYKMLAMDAKHNKVLQCVWANMPTELRALTKRNRTIVKKRKLDDPKEIEKRLKTLEKKETMETDENTEQKEKAGNNDNIEDDEDVEDEQEQEYELDDGTDYANNYFDNGEDYEEEDDNLDDGPVY